MEVHMDKMTLTIGTKSYTWAMGSVKFFWGPNYTKKFDIRQKLKQVYEKGLPSDYQESNEVIVRMEINDQRLNQKDWDFFEVTPFFSMYSDLKLTAKSKMSIETEIG